MEQEITWRLDNVQDFWEELDKIVTAPSDSHELIDDALRSYLAFAADFKRKSRPADGGRIPADEWKTII